MSTLVAEPAAHRLPQKQHHPDRRWRRWIASAALLGAGVALIVFAPWWRSVEVRLCAPLLHLVTGQRVQAVAATRLLVLYRGPSAVGAFLLTSECSVGYLLAGLGVLSAPLLLSRLAPSRVAAAVAVSAVVLVTVNVARVTAIGTAVSAWGPGRGFTFSHVYLGSTLAFIGTSLAGVAFAAVLLSGGRRRVPTRPAT